MLSQDANLQSRGETGVKHGANSGAASEGGRYVDRWDRWEKALG